MKKLVILDRTNLAIEVDENRDVKYIQHISASIDYVYNVEEDTEVYNSTNEYVGLATKNDIIIKLYKRYHDNFAPIFIIPAQNLLEYIEERNRKEAEQGKISEISCEKCSDIDESPCESAE